MTSFQWKLLFFCSLCLLPIFAWFSSSDLFKTPPDVAISRENFFNAKARYLANSAYWDAKQQQFTANLQQEICTMQCPHIAHHLQEMADEAVVSLVIRYGGGAATKNSLAVFQKENYPLHLIFSKYDTQWLMPIILSLEAELCFDDGHFSLHPLRLRKGAQDMDLSLARAYFSQELEAWRAWADEATRRS